MVMGDPDGPDYPGRSRTSLWETQTRVVLLLELLQKTNKSCLEILTDSKERARLRNVATALELQQLLREAGLRVTGPRVAVLIAVHAHPHADTDSIIEAVRSALPAVSHQAVYDCLRVLTVAGLVRRFQPSAVARYEARVGDNHHHLVCRSCGVISDVDCAVGAAPCLTASDDRGFTIDEAEVIYWGICLDCSPHEVQDQR